LDPLIDRGSRVTKNRRQWLLIKRADDEARSSKAADVTLLKPTSAVSALTIDEMEQVASKAVTAVRASKRGKSRFVLPRKKSPKKAESRSPCITEQQGAAPMSQG